MEGCAWCSVLGENGDELNRKECDVFLYFLYLGVVGMMQQYFGEFLLSAVQCAASSCPLFLVTR